MVAPASAVASPAISSVTNSLIAVERSFSEQGIVERFKVVQPPRDFMHGRVWDMVDDDV